MGCLFLQCALDTASSDNVLKGKLNTEMTTLNSVTWPLCSDPTLRYSTPSRCILFHFYYKVSLLLSSGIILGLLYVIISYLYFGILRIKLHFQTTRRKYTR